MLRVGCFVRIVKLCAGVTRLYAAGGVGLSVRVGGVTQDTVCTSAGETVVALFLHGLPASFPQEPYADVLV